MLNSLVLLAIAAVIGSVSLTYPFGRDQGIYAYTGKLLLEGKMNYKEVFDLKPPGIHFFFSFIQLISGESMLNARVFDILWQFITAVIVMIISSRLTRSIYLSILAAFLYIFLYYRLDYWHTLQADGALNLFFALTVLLTISSFYSHSFLKIFAAGLVFGVALLFKYTIISFLPLLLICFLLSKTELKSLRIKNTIVFLAGIVFILISVVLLYQFTGALPELINVQF
nr:glycosyltransferase family 39 protein [Ignavibacteria bacterium]